MEKTEAVSKLKKAGYQVLFDSSVVSVVISSGSNLNQEIKKLRAFLQEIGYDASFGIKQIKALPEREKQDSDEPVQIQAIENKEEEAADNGVEIGEQFSLEDFGIS